MRAARDRYAFIDDSLVMYYITEVTAKAGMEDHLRMAGHREDDNKSAMALE